MSLARRGKNAEKLSNSVRISPPMSVFKVSLKADRIIICNGVYCEKTEK